jgi:hypothetical protein
MKLDLHRRIDKRHHRFDRREIKPGQSTKRCGMELDVTGEGGGGEISFGGEGGVAEISLL